MIIDCHAHAYPDDLAPKVVGKIEGFYEVKAAHDGTLAGLAASMRESGVGRTVMAPVANRPEHVASVNAWIRESRGDYPAITFFGAFHPQVDEPLALLDALACDGVGGVKLQPNAQRFYPDAREYWPLYEKMTDHDFVVLFHAGDEVKPFEPLYAAPERFTAVLDSFPELSVVLAHLGGHKTWDDLDAVLGYGNVWYDTAYQPETITAEKFHELVDRIGIQNIVFGTDYPWADPSHDVTWIREALDDRKAGQVLEDNAETLLSR